MVPAPARRESAKNAGAGAQFPAGGGP